MRVHVIDPSAYTPPYDHALCAALAACGAQVELFTSRFTYAAPPAPAGYARREIFYGAATRALAHAPPGSAAAALRRALKLAGHVPGMLRYRRAARAADVAHFQWLAVPQLDARLLPGRRKGDGARRALVLTAHDVLPREPAPGQRAAQRRLFGRFDAVVVHSEHGRRRLTAELGLEPARVRVIPHGAFTHLLPAAGAQPPAPFDTGRPVALFFGLLRPYKGIELLLEAWHEVHGCELWIVGMPRMDIAPLRAAAPPGVRFVARFVEDRELAAYFARADVVVLPYREADQSGVLFTALAFGRPLLLSDVGGFPEIAAAGAARTFPAGDAGALAGALRDLLGDEGARAELSARALALARGELSWAAVARRTLALYEELLA